MKKALESIIDTLKSQHLIANRFYGKLTLSIEDGKIVLIRKEETIKP